MMRCRLKGIFGVGRPKLCGPVAFALHDHEFGEIFWIDEGCCRQVVNGVAQELVEGDMVFIRPADAHSLHSKGGAPFHLVNISFQWSHFLNLKARYFPQDHSLYNEDSRLPRGFRLEGKILCWARDAFTELLKSPRTAFFLERFLMNLFAELALVGEPTCLFDESAPGWMREAWRIMKEPSRLEEGVAGFSRLCGRSDGHVSREFRRHTGTTLVAAINRLRMDYAATLLAGSRREIVEIGMLCGFQSLSRFYQCFKESYGLTPRQYRVAASGDRTALGLVGRTSGVDV